MLPEYKQQVKIQISCRNGKNRLKNATIINITFTVNKLTMLQYL